MNDGISVALKRINTKRVKLIIKLAITAGCIYYISTRINMKEVSDAWAKSNGYWLFAAVCSFIISKLLASIRLNIFFKDIAVQLSQWVNIKLYWLGMFYNLFLPGSIGGDAYKVIRLARKYEVPYKKTTMAVLLDRFSGLFALFLLTAVLWWIVFEGGFYSWLVMIGSIVIIPVAYLIIGRFFPVFRKSFFPTYLWALPVQLFQVITMFCLLNALQINEHYPEYLLLFMISSVVAVLPFTIGGLGGRELVFLWGAQLFDLQIPVAVAASFLFYFTTLVSSSLGFPMIFADPLKDEHPEK